MNELKPCPFCGGEAEIVGSPENWTPTFYDPDSGGDPIAVVCKTCACGLHFFDSYAEAASAWNNRPDNWISIEERLPKEPSREDIEADEFEEYIVMILGATLPTALLYYGSGNFRDYDGEDYKVTHWQPLPEPPKGVT